MVVKFKEENLMTFRHVFLKDYVDGGMDTYAVYSQAEVYDHVDYIIGQVTKFLFSLLKSKSTFFRNNIVGMLWFFLLI